MIRKNVIITVCCLVILLLVSFYIYQFEIGSFVSANTVYPEVVSVSENKVVITGGTMNSALAYSGYKSYLKDNALYIKLRYVLVGSIINKRTGKFNLEIEGDFRNVEEIYFEGPDALDYKSIWKEEK